MRAIALLIMCFAFAVTVSGQAEKPSDPVKSPDKTYNAALAEKLGADDYGMRQYVFVILKTGKAKIENEERRSQLQAGHMKSIAGLAEAGKLVLAGPFIEGGEMRGVYVLDVKTLEEAAELVKTDPAIAAGLFDVELTRWYGSAALVNLNDVHKNIQKKSF